MTREDRGRQQTPREQLLATAVTWFAEHGIGDTSLRGIAEGLGTSHRMLIHHFGGRGGLLLAVVEQVENEQRRHLADLATAGVDGADPATLGRQFWAQLCDVAETYGPLFFELTAAAMRKTDYAAPLRGAVEEWLGPLTALWRGYGMEQGRAERFARLSLAMARGLLHDLLLSTDRAGVEEAVDTWLDMLAREMPAPAGK